MLSNPPKRTSTRLCRRAALVAALLCATTAFGQTQTGPPKTVPKSVARNNPVSTPSKSPTLLLRSDADCKYNIDGVPSGELTAGVIKTINIDLGEHLFEAFAKDGADKWETVVAADKPIQKVVLVELAKIRAARVARIQEAARLREEIRTKQQKTAELEAERKKLAEQQAELEAKRSVERKEILEKQAALNAKRKDLRMRIETLQIQLGTENDAAIADEEAAAAGDRGYAATAGSTNSALQVLGGVNQAGASFRRLDAQSHRAEARKLQRQVEDLQRDLLHLQEQEMEERAAAASVTSPTQVGVPADVRKYLANPAQSEIDRKLQNATDVSAQQKTPGQKDKDQH